mmetsp:Transcript_41142/g.103719  ORF Transcript_41142/g.103719 Transcript_41142/m.103719 type:complete len:1017 (-) Transcript_41142:1263-4313(-)
MADAREPLDPALKRADMLKCPRWILVKLNAEVKNRNELQNELTVLRKQSIQKEQELRSQISNLSASSSLQSSTSCDDLEGKLTQREADLRKMIGLVKTHRQSEATLKATLEERDVEVANLKSQVQELTAKLDKVQKQALLFGRAAETQANEVARLADELEAALRQAQEAAQCRSELEEKLARSSSMSGSTATVLLDMKAKLRTTKDDLAATQARLERSESELHRLKTAIRSSALKRRGSQPIPKRSNSLITAQSMIDLKQCNDLGSPVATGQISPLQCVSPPPDHLAATSLAVSSSLPCIQSKGPMIPSLSLGTLSPAPSSAPNTSGAKRSPRHSLSPESMRLATPKSTRTTVFPIFAFQRYVSRSKLLSGDAILMAICDDHSGTTIPAVLSSANSSSVDHVVKSVVHLLAREPSSDKVIRMIKRVIEAEVSSTGDHTTLFRGNSVASKIMACYARLVGSSYLKKVLGDKLHHWIAVSSAFEGSRDDPEAAATSADLVVTEVDAFLKQICESLDDMPLQFRQIARMLYEATTSRWPDDESVKYVPIAGFLFLRYFCSSVTAPEGYGVMDGEVPASARRGLIRISKAVQSIANGTLPKDEEMEQHTEWFRQWTARLREFYQQITEPPSANVESASPSSLMTRFEIAEKLFKHLKNRKEQLLSALSSDKPNKQVFRLPHSVKLSMWLHELLVSLAGNVSQRNLVVTAFRDVLSVDIEVVDIIAATAAEHKAAVMLEVGNYLLTIYEVLEKPVALLQLLIVCDLFDEVSQFHQSMAAATFTLYCQRIAENQIKEHFGPFVAEVRTYDRALEIDHHRVLPEERDLLAGNTVRLIELCDRLFDVILPAFISQLPRSIWSIGNWMLETVPTQYKKKAPITPFLVFSCFANVIENPQQFGLTEDDLPARTRRTLFLVAELLRSAALGKPSSPDVKRDSVFAFVLKTHSRLSDLIKDLFSSARSTNLDLKDSPTREIAWRVQKDALEGLHRFMLQHADQYTESLDEHVVDLTFTFTTSEAFGLL